MEQGDHVTKSPWSNWQIGANDFYNDWHGHFRVEEIGFRTVNFTKEMPQWKNITIS